MVLLTELGGVPGCSYGALAVFGVLVGRRRGQAVPARALLVLAAMLCGYYAVFVALSPADPGWHARTAIPRLLLHLWPASLCAVLAFLRDPFEAPNG
jgi:hypothetical protein